MCSGYLTYNNIKYHVTCSSLTTVFSCINDKEECQCGFVVCFPTQDGAGKSFVCDMHLHYIISHVYMAKKK